MSAEQPSSNSPEDQEGAVDRRAILLDEFDQCREEDRDARSQMLQTVAVCMAALAAVFAIAANLFGGSGASGSQQPDQTIVILCELVTVSIIIASFSYLLSLGIVAPLRYYRMRELEQELNIIPADQDRIGWVEFRAAHTSLNPRHLYSKASALHYSSLLMAIVGVIVACICFFLLFGKLNYRLTVVLLFLVAVPYIAFALAIYFWCTSRAEDWYQQTEKIVRAKRERRTPAGAVRPNFKRFVRYLLYPRPQDALKNGFLLLGCLLGIAFNGGDFGNPETWFSSLPIIVFVWFVFDALGYQSRYQWNDIRGAREDGDNPRSAMRGRLCKLYDDVALAKKASAVAIIYKMVLASALAILWGGRVSAALLFGIIAIWIIAVVYEVARRRNWPFGVLFNLVCLGYPLRMLVGFLALAPNGLLAMPSSLILSVAFLLVATYAYGKVFVGITWALEGADFRSGDTSEDRPPKELGVYHKPHVIKLASEIEGYSDRLSGVDNVILQELPLSYRSPVVTHWNVWMFATAMLLAVGIARSFVIASCSLQVAMMVLMLHAAWFVEVLLWPSRIKLGITLGIAVAAVPLALIFGVWDLCPDLQLVDAEIIGILVLASFAYMAIYLMFRNTNYKKMVAMPLYFLFAVKWVFTRIKNLLIDEQTDSFQDYLSHEIERCKR